MEITNFKQYSEYEDPEIMYYSGQSTWRVDFDLPDSIADKDPLYLSIGDVADGYGVSLNGHSLGSAVFPDYRFYATSIAQAGNNTLEIRVGNSFRNRIIGEMISDGELKTLWTTSPIHNYLDPGKPLTEAGISGPVRFMW
jgi:hypothetical protein